MESFNVCRHAAKSQIDFSVVYDRHGLGDRLTNSQTVQHQFMSNNPRDRKVEQAIDLGCHLYQPVRVTSDVGQEDLFSRLIDEHHLISERTVHSPIDSHLEQGEGRSRRRLEEVQFGVAPVIHVEAKDCNIVVLISVVYLSFEGRRLRPADASVVTEEEEQQDLAFVVSISVLPARKVDQVEGGDALTKCRVQFARIQK